MSLVSTDPIADMLTRIRNGIAAGKTEIRMPASRVKLMVATKLQKSGYIFSVKTEKASPRDELVLTVAAAGTNPTINEIDRVSRPGRRVYASASDIPRVKTAAA